MKRGALHENFERLEHESPTESSFGWTFAALALLIGGVRLYSRHQDGWIWIAVALMLAALARFAPRALAPFNRAWFRFSLLLTKFVSPIMMGVVYFLLITPMGLFARMRGRKLLELERDPNVDSYWKPADETKSKFENQF